MSTVRIPVSDLEFGPVVRIPPTTSLRDAARLLDSERSDTLVVDSSPLSEITRHDVVRAVAAGIDPQTTVAELARAEPLFLDSETGVEDAAAQMFGANRYALVVIDKGSPVGVAHARSVAEALCGTTTWISALRIALRTEGI